VLIQPNIKQFTTECYKRIFDGVRLKSYTTSAGFQPASIGMSICAATADNMIKYATKELGESVRTEFIKVHHIIPE